MFQAGVRKTLAVNVFAYNAEGSGQTSMRNAKLSLAHHRGYR